jgi:hypothetical protein
MNGITSCDKHMGACPQRIQDPALVVRHLPAQHMRTPGSQPERRLRLAGRPTAGRRRGTLVVAPRPAAATLVGPHRPGSGCRVRPA